MTDNPDTKPAKKPMFSNSRLAVMTLLCAFNAVAYGGLKYNLDHTTDTVTKSNGVSHFASQDGKHKMEMQTSLYDNMYAISGGSALMALAFGGALYRRKKNESTPAPGPGPGPQIP